MDYTLASRQRACFGCPVSGDGQNGYCSFSGEDNGNGGGCSCKAGDTAAAPISGIESAVKSHPFLTIMIAGLIGYALNDKRGRV